MRSQVKHVIVGRYSEDRVDFTINNGGYVPARYLFFVLPFPFYFILNTCG